MLPSYMPEKWRATVKLKDPEGILHTCYQEAGTTNPKLRKENRDAVIREVCTKIADLNIVDPREGLSEFSAEGPDDALSKLKAYIEDERECGKVNTYPVMS